MALRIAVCVWRVRVWVTLLLLNIGVLLIIAFHWRVCVCAHVDLHADAVPTLRVS